MAAQNRKKVDIKSALVCRKILEGAKNDGIRVDVCAKIHESLKKSYLVVTSFVLQLHKHV